MWGKEPAEDRSLFITEILGDYSNSETKSKATTYFSLKLLDPKETLVLDSIFRETLYFKNSTLQSYKILLR